MKHKNFFLRATLLFALILMLPTGMWGTETTLSNKGSDYTLVDQNGNPAANWAVNSSGMTKTGTSTNSYTNISQVVVNFSSLGSSNAGKFKMELYIGDELIDTRGVIASGSGTALNNLVQTFTVQNKTGQVKVKLSRTTSNSNPEISSIVITYASAPVSSNVFLLGGFNSWTEGETSEFVSKGGTLTLAVDLEASTNYEFKVKEGDTWYSYQTQAGNSKITWNDCTNWTLYTGNNNSKITTTYAGTYVFTYSASDHKLNVAYPEHAYLVGQFNDWEPADANDMLNGSVVVALAAETTYEFKVNHQVLRGNSGTMSSTNCTGWTMDWQNNNACKITTTDAGDYKFSYNFTNCQISVSYPNQNPISEEFKADGQDVSACNYTGKLFNFSHNNAPATAGVSSAKANDESGKTFTKGFLPSGATSATACYTFTAKENLEKIIVYYITTDSKFTSQDQSKSGNLMYQIGSASVVTSSTTGNKSNKTAYAEVIQPNGGIAKNSVIKIYASANRLAIFSIVAFIAPEYTEKNLTVTAVDAKNTHWTTFSNNQKVTFWPEDNATIMRAEGTTFVTLDAQEVSINAENVSGYYVPAGEGVLVKAESASVVYYVVDYKSMENLETNNLIPGTGSEIAESGYKYYKLAWSDANHTRESLGFYWASSDGLSVTKSTEGKAYLRISQSEAPARILLNPETFDPGISTDVESVHKYVNTTHKTLVNGKLHIVRDNKVFDLNGRLVK